MHIFIGYLVILFLVTYSTQGLVNLKDASPREKILDNVEQSSKKYNPGHRTSQFGQSFFCLKN